MTIGIALDVQDKVYVSERFNHRISVFTSKGQFVITSKGQFVTSFGSGGLDPRGLAVDSNGVVYVCDFNNHLLQLF